MSHFFAYLSRMKLIKRWGLMRNTTEENIQEHSLQTAIIAHALALIRNRFFEGGTDPERIMALAVFHEAGEVITGDLATPIKYFNPEIKKSFGELEELAKEKILNMLPGELRKDYQPYFFVTGEDYENYKIVKAADKICAYIKCVEELKMGNQEFSQAERGIRRELAKLDMPEVVYFMEHFIPSFSLTLDELN